MRSDGYDETNAERRRRRSLQNIIVQGVLPLHYKSIIIIVLIPISLFSVTYLQLLYMHD